METNPTSYSRPDPIGGETSSDWTPPSTASTAVSDLAAYSEDTIQPILDELTGVVERIEEEVNRTQDQQGG